MPTRAWLCDSLHRQFPLSLPGRGRTLSLPIPRGGRASFQAYARAEGEKRVDLSIQAEAPDGLSVTVRRIGVVPVPHHGTGTPPEELDGLGCIPGFVPDPLYPETTVKAAPRESTGFWLSVEAAPDARPGPRDIRVKLQAGERQFDMTASVQVSNVVLRPRRGLPVTHWFYADALCDWYRVEPFSKEFWPIFEKYVRNYVAHGSDTLYVPVFTPPLDGVKRPTQLLRVTETAPGRYAFDWRHVKRWIAIAQRCGVRNFEWTHFFTQWGVKNAIRIYHGHGLDERLLWPPETGATSDTYRNFLSQFLPALKRFLDREGLLSRSFFHVSDEPRGPEMRENYRRARGLLRDLAPWMKVMDALSEIEYGREGLTDMPVPSITKVRQFAEEGIDCWAYFCCGPRGKYINRLLDTPLPKIRMLGWLLYRFNSRGFLHWGYNYWYQSQTRRLIDPFTVTDGLGWPNWSYGDTSVVYPGPDGPLDSIRWEVFAESLQDYTLLETLSVDPTGSFLSPCRDFDDFPKDPRWHAAALRKLLKA